MTDEFQIDEWLAEDVTPEHKRDWPAWTPVWEALILSDLSDRAVRLYAVLGRYSGEKGAWPSRRRLAGDLRCSENSVDRAKAELADAGWIGITGQVRSSDNGQTSNLYTLRQRPGSPSVGHPLHRSEDPPLPTGAAPRTTPSKNDNPPTPQSAVAPERTYPSGPMRRAEELAKLDGRPKVSKDRVTALKDSLRPRDEPDG